MTDIAQSPPSAVDKPGRTTTDSSDALVPSLTGLDPAHRALGVAPAVAATLSPLIAALRWCAVVLGTALAAPDAVDGDVALVITNSVCLYVTTWRTMRPIRLGAPDRGQAVVALTDTVLLGAATGLTGGAVSPFTGCIAAAAAVAAFGWGTRRGIVAVGTGVGTATIVALASGRTTGLAEQTGWIVVGALVAAVVLLGALRSRLVAAENRRAALAGRLDALAETNQLLHVLNRVARTLPSSLDLQQAVTATRGQLMETFDAPIVGLFTQSDLNGSWAPLLAEGLAMPPAIDTADLPQQLSSCLESGGPLLVRSLDGSGLGPASGTGMYTPLQTRGRVVGLLAVEHPTPGRYSERDARLLAGLGEALALTIDNARWFRRLRILGAEEERSRIARDLHDRLGQWLTYISFELERIKSNPELGDPSELDALHGDVQRAIDELRETLRQLRTTVTEEQGLSDVARELTDRYARQSGLHIELHLDERGERFPVAVENELLRVMQEALNNVSKHANATSVRIDWTVEPHVARLRIADDGDGFDEARGVRETAFGLVGMRERAEVIDAELNVTSSPGEGTTIEVTVPREDRR